MKAVRSIVVVVLALSTTVRAQTVPLASIELVGGNGIHNSQVGSTRFTDDPRPTIRYALSYRVTAAGRRALYVKLDVQPPYFGERIGALCQTPFGAPCPGSFPAVPGVGLGLGERYALSRYVYIGALAGIGRYGAPRSTAMTTPFAEGEVLVRLVRHVGVIAAARYQTWHGAEGRYWYAPLTAGIQLF